VHASGGFEAIVANGFGLFGEEVKEFVFLNAFFSDAPHNLKLLFGSQSATKIKKKKSEIRTLRQKWRESKSGEETY